MFDLVKPIGAGGREGRGPWEARLERQHGHAVAARVTLSGTVAPSSPALGRDIQECELKRIYSHASAQFRHRAMPLACLLPAPRVAVASVLALILIFGSAGCSYQLESLRSKNGSEVEQTGPIASETASHASQGDLAVARAAVSEMLGKGGKTTSVPWENPRTGARGTVTPLASAYTQNGVTCHDFLASYVRDGSTSWLQGEACRAKPGRWEVRKLTARRS